MQWPGPPCRDQMDGRLKVELRYAGPESESEYDGHYDDKAAERLCLNGAHKARLLEPVDIQSAYQN